MIHDTFNRRSFLLATAGAGLMVATPRWAWAKQDEPFALPTLPYAYDELEPHLDAATMEIHHSRHHAAYVRGLNAAVRETEYAEWPIERLLSSLSELPEGIRTAVRNMGGGHANHTLFWKTLSSKGGGEPSGELGDAMTATFGDFNAFWEKLTAATMGVFGSGWGWLSWQPGQGLIIESTSNQDSPLSKGNIPLFGIDVWEHAYYLKYQNRRADYLAAIRNVVHWEFINERFREARA